MSVRNICFICETYLDVQQVFCSCCNFQIPEKSWIEMLSFAEKSVYLGRIKEAKVRWLKWGRYDQSPKNSNLSFTSASSSNSVSIGGEFV